MSNLVCGNCKSIAVEHEGYCGGASYYLCKTCGQHGDKDKFTPQTVFHSITASPDALADKLVYKTLVVGNNRVTYSCWRSTITEESYRTKKEAIDATLVELERVTERETIEEEE